jgi:hypothetical protein
MLLLLLLLLLLKMMIGKKKCIGVYRNYAAAAASCVDVQPRTAQQQLAVMPFQSISFNMLLWLRTTV